MDFLTLEMAALGAVGIVGLLVVARLFRKGLSTYTVRRKTMETRIRTTMAEIRDRNQAMPVREQMDVLAAALDEVLYLAGHPSDVTVARQNGLVVLHTPHGVWEIRYQSRAAALRSQKRVLHSAGQWEVRGPDTGPECFNDLATLIRRMNALVRVNDTG